MSPSSVSTSSRSSATTASTSSERPETARRQWPSRPNCAPISSSWTSRCRSSTGIPAAEQLSKDHIAPVVLLTAFSQKELVEQASEAGALAYVVKPFTPNDLLPAIEIALARYAQIIALEAEVGDLVERFETRKLVDRAKGLLNEKMGLSEPEAFRWIQKASMDRRLTMHDVAQAIIEQLAPKKA